MTQSISIVLVGVGGYGGTYVRALLDQADRSHLVLSGVVDPYADRCVRLDELRALGATVVDTQDAFYRDHAADLAVISSPIHLHAPQTVRALQGGSHVLCEKPLGATFQEMTEMITARDAANKTVGIGYQWSHSPVIQSLKRDIMRGRFGAPRRLRTMALWPRGERYYHRNQWAGAKQDPQGRWILDSPVNNATAHYLHNMLYLLGPTVDRAARPKTVVSELYRANDITNYDTGIVRCWTDDGVEILFITSHAVNERIGPVMRLEFEDAVITTQSSTGGIVATLTDGARCEYGDPSADVENKLWLAMDVARGQGRPLCPPEAAGMQTLCMNGMQESKPDILPFPPDLVRKQGEPGDQLTYVAGLAAMLQRCFEANQLPSELGDVAWAQRGQEIDLSGYSQYPSDAGKP